jgi:ABC-2 type transport system permease protein
MQPDHLSVRRICQKELALFFASPLAWLFLLAFISIELFVFFWAEAFFARNIADVRPLFQWMPLLLLFLAATLTMRLWSDERRSGTLEHILTSPQPLWHFIAGKFMACMLLLLLALTLTLPMPITVSLLAELDWGPVLSGYLAALLLGAAYLAMGLFVSSRTDNAIVALLGSVLLGLLFYLPGSSLLAGLVSADVAAVLGQFSTSSRFDAITRGVIDLRDLYFYLSLAAVFLVLNALMLERERWARERRLTPAQWGKTLLTGLVAANVVGANFWLGQLPQLRLDTTAGAQYSLSEVSKRQLAGLQEPLLIRGYFSANTHPLLAPLVPQLQDLLKEYQVAGRGKVKLELVDPTTDAALEQEANQQYQIEPVPFQVADRHQSAIVSSYFHVLLQYGSEHKVLSFRDFIDVKTQGEADLQVLLRNPEYDISRQIKKLQAQYQSGGDLLAQLPGTVTLNAYVSPEAELPAQLKTVLQQLPQSLQQIRGRHNKQLPLQQQPMTDPAVTERISNTFGAQPMVLDLLQPQPFWFFLTLQLGERELAIPLSALDQPAMEQAIKATLQRFVPGLEQTVALVSGSTAPAGYGAMGSSFNQLRDLLGTELNVISEDLADGKVAAEADVLVLLAPKDLNEKQVFAVDQFLMQGGTVIAATSPYDVSVSQRSLGLTQIKSGLQEFLAAQGLSIDSTLVLDPQHSTLPVPVTRQAGGFSFQQIAMLPYPYFADLRPADFTATTGPAEQQQLRAILGDLPQLTVPWASPININAAVQQQPAAQQLSEAQQRSETQNKPALQYQTLLSTSSGSWRSNSLDVMPAIGSDGQVSYPGDTASTSAAAVAVMVSGEFGSFFSDKPHPLREAKPDNTTKPDDQTKTAADTALRDTGLLKKAAPGARLILISSNSMFSDQTLQLAGSSNGSQYLNNLQLLQNMLSFALADTELSSIRSRAQFNRTLPTLSPDSRSVLEYANYGIALLLLGLLFGAERYLHARKKARYQQLVAM